MSMLLDEKGEDPIDRSSTCSVVGVFEGDGAGIRGGPKDVFGVWVIAFFGWADQDVVAEPNRATLAGDLN